MKDAGIKEVEKIEDDGIDWHDFIIVQTIDLFEDMEQPKKLN
jgi:hypothetical protein